jgi:hypothetical protein
MSSTQVADTRTNTFRPEVTAAVGYLVYALSALAGEGFGLNIDARTHGVEDHTAGELARAWAPEFAIGLVGVAIAVVVGRWAWTRADRLARTSLVLAVLAAATVVAFWAGWSIVFGAVAIGLALENRRRLGSFGASVGIALVLGALAFVAAAAMCLLG